MFIAILSVHTSGKEVVPSEGRNQKSQGLSGQMPQVQAHRYG
jgi:hypothetical protein